MLEKIHSSATLESAGWVTAVSDAMLDDLHKVSPNTIPKSSRVYNGAEIVGQAQRTSISEEKSFLLAADWFATNGWTR